MSRLSNSHRIAGVWVQNCIQHPTAPADILNKVCTKLCPASKAVGWPGMVVACSRTAARFLLLCDCLRCVAGMLKPEAAWYFKQVLEVLTEVAFEAEFLSTRIEKERRAVMAEAQMMNTIEYRVDCQLLQYLHEENALGFRFPIGKMDQVSAHLLPCLCASLHCWSRTVLTSAQLTAKRATLSMPGKPGF